jgi:hypothetical protein
LNGLNVNQNKTNDRVEYVSVQPVTDRQTVVDEEWGVTKPMNKNTLSSTQTRKLLNSQADDMLLEDNASACFS